MNKLTEYTAYCQLSLLLLHPSPVERSSNSHSVFDKCAPQICLAEVGVMKLKKVWTNFFCAQTVAAPRVPTATIVREGSLSVNFQKTGSRSDISVQLNELHPPWMLFFKQCKPPCLRLLLDYILYASMFTTVRGTKTPPHWGVAEANINIAKCILLIFFYFGVTLQNNPPMAVTNPMLSLHTQNIKKNLQVLLLGLLSWLHLLAEPRVKGSFSFLGWYISRHNQPSNLGEAVLVIRKGKSAMGHCSHPNCISKAPFLESVLLHAFLWPCQWRFVC